MATAVMNAAGPEQSGLARNPTKKFPPGTITPKEGPAEQVEECPCGCGCDIGPNFEKLEQVHPQLVAAMRELMLAYRVEGIVSRRWEARKAQQAHLAWMGIQNGYYNGGDWQWHLPFGTSVGLGLGVEDPFDDYKTPSYDYVTNYYQAYGLAFQALMTSKVPTPKFYPKSAQNEADITMAKAADDVRKLNEKNNPPKKLLKKYSWLGWCEGKIGSYGRWVIDGQRFGFDTVVDVDADLVQTSQDAYICPQCGAENPVMQGSADAGYCQQCAAELSQDDFQMANYAPVPRVTGTRKVPRGQWMINFPPGLEFHTPPWAESRHDYPYLQWNKEVHKAKLKASYPHAADKITSGGPVLADDAQIRVWRIQVAQGFPVQLPGDAMANLVTFSRTWLRPWAFWEIEDKKIRDLALKMYPDGAFVAFAGEAYCESRNENMDEHWRVSHLLEGDGQNRPGVGDSSLQVNKQINDLSNVEQEAADYGIGITFAGAKTLNQDEIEDSTARPGDIVSVMEPKAGESVGDKFFQTTPTVISPEAIARRQELQGPVLQFLTGIEPAALGAPDASNTTAEGRNVARETALGRLGLFYQEMSGFYGETHLLGVRGYAKNATGDTEIPTESEGGGFESKYIRLAEMKGEIELFEEPDEGFPALPSEVRASIEQMLDHPILGPMLLQSPLNVGRAKDTMGLEDYVAPGEDMRTKTMRMIKELLKSGPIQPPPQMAVGANGPIAMPSQPQATVQIDPDLDDPLVAMAEVKRWYQSDAGQEAAEQNPDGLANVRAFFQQCRTVAAAQSQQASQQKPPSESINFKDLPPGGQAQMAQQAGIQLDPNELAQKQQQEQEQKRQQHEAKLASLNKGGAQEAAPPS